jgi:hypothetical protein
MSNFANSQERKVVPAQVQTIINNKAYLSEVDGEIGVSQLPPTNSNEGPLRELLLIRFMRGSTKSLSAPHTVSQIPTTGPLQVLHCGFGSFALFEDRSRATRRMRRLMETPDG